MTVQLNRQLFTVSDYYKMAETGILSSDQRYELLNGEIIKMSPQKSLHSSITTIIAEEFIFYLKGKAEIRCQLPIKISNHSEPEPDISIQKLKEGRYRDAHPTPKDVFLIIEVSDSTLAKDRTIKKKMYAESNIPKYWIVNIPEKQIEIFEQPEKGEYQKTTILKSGVVEFSVLDKKVQISVQDLF